MTETGAVTPAALLRIGLLTQWYPPEPGPAALPGVLARELAARGHDVRVLTGFPNYPSGNLAEGYSQRLRHTTHEDGVTVRRVPLYTSHDASALRRLTNYGSFAASATALGLGVLKDVDVLWVNYSPVTIGLPMLGQRALQRMPIVMHVMDLWPDTLTASGFAGGGIGSRGVLRGLGRWCQTMYRSADRVAYISPSVGSVLAARGVTKEKLAYAPMWADESLFAPFQSRTDRGWDIRDDEVVLVYAGTLGRAQGLETLVRACAQVAGLPIRCLIAGSGVEEQHLRDLADEVGAANVHFLGRVPSEQMPRLMATGDMHYVSLNDDPLAAMTMPSKLQATMASSRAVLGSVTGDAAGVIRDAHAGWVAPPGDVAALAKVIEVAVGSGREKLQAVGQQARVYYEGHFSMSLGVSRIEDMMRQVVATSRAGR